MIPATPNKPFPAYKWRWASYQPTEGLLRPDIYLGVLRVFRSHEGEKPSAPAVSDSLRVVQQQTNTNVDLVRSPERNLIRNSGQYWKATGLIEPLNGKIELTTFGHQVAEGRVTDTEFALAVVKTLSLPNARIDSEAHLKTWQSAGLEIKPLELILSIMSRLSEVAGGSEGYITANELIQVVIPLAGVKTPINDHADALLAFRQGTLNVSSWPDCAPDANDKRMVREFLLFLWHHGLCRYQADPDARRYDLKFFLSSLDIQDIAELNQMPAEQDDLAQMIKDVRQSKLPAIVEEGQRVLVSVLARPQQARFRKDVLKAYASTCLITGEKLSVVLEAAHLVPKGSSGADTANNGLCLRSDIHSLFDGGHIRIEPSGTLHYSDAMRESVSYTALPSEVELPKFLSPEAVEWRWRYK